MKEFEVMDFQKPDAPIIGADGNVFNLLAITKQVLEDAGQKKEAKEMVSRVMKSGTYDEALAIMCEFVNPIEEGGE